MEGDAKEHHVPTPNQLRDVLGAGLVPTELAGFPVELISNDVIGLALADLLSRTFASFFEANWTACLRQCDVILDITWEELNTGYWKDVDVCWRYVYATASWIKALSQFAIASAVGVDDGDEGGWRSLVREAVKVCDMGLLMGAPVRENVLSKLASRLQAIYSSRPAAESAESTEPPTESTEPPTESTEPATESTEPPTESTEPARHKRPRLADDVRREPVIERPVGVVRKPSLEYFRTEHMAGARPVVIADAMDFWPAMAERRWSVGYIRTVAGCRTVPVEIGSRYTDDDWSQRLMTVDEFVAEYIERSAAAGRRGYLAQHDLFGQIPELRRDIYVPSYCGLCADVDDDDPDDDDDVEINAWFGPAGTVSPLHHDPKHNLLCQVVGEKYVRLYGAEYTDLLYPHDGRLLANTSRVDVENPDLDSFPDFVNAPYTECVLRPGQMLYIPPKCWHYIRSLSVSFSISFWWGKRR